MGSFNASCAVSKCSINPGDRVKLIPIVSNTSLHEKYSNEMHNGFGCYCYDYFSCLGLPMDATYEDYGEFEVIPNLNSEYNLSIIKDNYTMTPATPNSHDRNCCGIPASDLDWNTIGKMIHHGGMYLDSTADLSMRRFMGFFPILESVYNVMLERLHEMYIDNHFKDVSFSEYYEHKIQELSGVSRQLEEKITEYMELFGDNIGETNTKGHIITAEEIYEKAVQMAHFSLDSHSSRIEYSYKNTADKNKINNYYSQVTGRSLDGQTELDVIKSICELKFIVCALSSLHIPILPPMTAGQEYDKTSHAAFLVKIGKTIMDFQQENDIDDFNENVATARIIAVFDISVKRLKECAVGDYRSARGELAIKLINDLVLEYPNGVLMSSSDFNESKYSLLGQYIESSLFDMNFIIDFDEEIIHNEE